MTVTFESTDDPIQQLDEHL